MASTPATQAPRKAVTKRAPARKTPAKAAAKPVTKMPVTKKPAAKKPVTKKPAAKPAAKAATKPLAKAAHKAKQKPVRDSFTMPKADFDLIDALKQRALSFKHPVKKSELLRAGLHALSKLDNAQLGAIIGQLTPIKPGRPKNND